MSWILADLLMFVCSIAVYLAVRKAALDKLPSQFNNLAMFAIPLLIFIVASVITRSSFALTLSQVFVIIVTGVVFSYLGNAMSMVSIKLAPNGGYSLVLSKSYVVLTSILAVPLFGAQLTVPAIIAIGLIVGSSAFIMINPRVAHRAKSNSWVLLALGAFLCWAFLSLSAKHLISQGIPTLVFLTYVFAIATTCIVIEMKLRKINLGIITKQIQPFMLIGVAATGFNFFNFYAISLAPNVGYVNATNAASIGAVTALSVILFKDELTRQKLIGTIGVIAGLLLLFIWK
jgi:drug/metabolite transporter (DMT)-like permease